MSTERQQAASRANGAKSHGPTSAAGKQRSSQNALKHGFFAQTHLHPDDAARLPHMLRLWLDDHDPQDTQSIAQTLRGALASVRLLRLVEIDHTLAQHRTENALNQFDANAANRLEDLIAQLKDRPHATVIQLEQTPDGIDWLIEQWRTIDQALDLEPSLSLPDFTQALLLHGLHPDERRQTRITRGFSSWNQVASGKIPGASNDGKTPAKPITPERAKHAHDRIRKAVDQHIARLEALKPAAEALAARNRERAPILALNEDTTADARRHRAEAAAGLALDRAIRHLGRPIQPCVEEPDENPAKSEETIIREQSNETKQPPKPNNPITTTLLAILLPLALLLGQAIGRNHSIPNATPTLAAVNPALPTPTTATTATPQATAAVLDQSTEVQSQQALESPALAPQNEPEPLLIFPNPETILILAQTAPGQHNPLIQRPIHMPTQPARFLQE